MNRPEKRNALNRALGEGLKTAWTEYSQDDEAYVAVLTGAGGNDLPAKLVPHVKLESQLSHTFK